MAMSHARSVAMMSSVASIMSNPDQDPHLFEGTRSTVRQIAAAQGMILNGADYDPWMDKLLKASPKSGRTRNCRCRPGGQEGRRQSAFVVRTRHHAGGRQGAGGPLSRPTPCTRMDMLRGSKLFLPRSNRSTTKLPTIRGKFAGTTVTASEPVFGYMADAFGLKMRNESFQLSIMNDTEPSAHDVAAFQDDLKGHKVRVMFYNKQASNKAVQTLVDLAHATKIPVVGVTETAPHGLSYQKWMLMQLDETEKALAASS